jgi:NADH:ubiquinone reductase (non-electrogenic)
MSSIGGAEWPPRREIVIIGSGWAGSTLATSLDETKYSITVISPETTTPYTPLLASAACGLYEFNLVETPIRHTNKKIKFVKARVSSIDFKAKTVKCVPAFEDLIVKEFVLHYDIVVIAPGVGLIFSSSYNVFTDFVPFRAQITLSLLPAYPHTHSSSGMPKTP